MPGFSDREIERMPTLRGARKSRDINTTRVWPKRSSIRAHRTRVQIKRACIYQTNVTAKERAKQFSAIAISPIRVDFHEKAQGRRKSSLV